jgi:hypothetical protein
MKRLALLTIALFSSYALASAQTLKMPEFFAGYSYESVDTGIKSTDFTTTTTSFDNRFKLNGFNFSAADYFTRHFGIAADFSAHFDTRTDSVGTTIGQTKISLYNITGGPQIRFPNTGRFTPFAQALAGVARRNFTETIASTATSYADNSPSVVSRKFLYND